MTRLKQQEMNELNAYFTPNTFIIDDPENQPEDSVHSNPGLWAYENGNEMDFLDALRLEDGLEGAYSEVPAKN